MLWARRRCLQSLGLLLPCAASAQGGVSVAPLRPDWQFRAASPFSAPAAVAATGQGYLVTHEGYIHALSSRGSFLWSYTVQGALLEGAVTDEAGRAFVASTTGHVYGVNPSGSPHWVYQSPVRPQTPLAYSSRRLLYFASERFLYAISTRRGVLWRALLSNPVAAGPLCDPQGRAWLITTDGSLHIISKPWSRTRQGLQGADTYRLLQLDQSGALVLAGNELQHFALSGERTWRAAGFVTAAADGEWVAAVRASPAGATLAWLRRGRVVRERPLAAAAAAAPWVQAEPELVALPGVDGVLRAFAGPGAELSEYLVSQAPLLRPVSGPSGRLWVASGDGSLSVFLQWEAE